MNTPAIIRKGFFIIKNLKEERTTLPVASMAAIELLNLGFIASPHDLTFLSVDELKDLVKQAARLIGADRTWQPLYPGFPQEVLETAERELYINAIFHYLSQGEWRPEYNSSLPRKPLTLNTWPENPIILQPLEPTETTVIETWGKTLALSQTDREFCHDIVQYLESDITPAFRNTTFKNGENFAFALHEVLIASNDNIDHALQTGIDCARNIDDVLRSILAVFSVNQDRARDLLCTKKEPVSLRSIPRSSRAIVIRALKAYTEPYNLDLLARRRKIWQIIMRRIHPYDVPGHNNVRQQLDIIHANNNYRTVNSLIEQSLHDRKLEIACKLLQDAPGNYVRKIHHLLRLSNHSNESIQQANISLVETGLRNVAHRVRLSTLISAYNGLLNQNSEVVVTALSGRGNVIRYRSHHALDETHIDGCLQVLRKAMVRRLKETTPPDGPVAIENTIPVELVRRNASSSIHEYSRGEHIALNFNSNSILRLFVHWYGNDVDLGVVFTDENIKETLAYVDYTRLRDKKLRKSVTHSGDIVSAPKPDGACEFIDITVGKEAKRTTLKTPHKTILDHLPNARYAIISLISYRGGTFDNIDNVVGVMARNHGMAGQLFEPRTVTTAMSANAKSTNCIPCIVDLVERTMIWLDASTGTAEGMYSAHESKAVLTVRAELSALQNSLTVGELMQLWAQAHNSETSPQHAQQQQATRLLTEC
ncbi:hypothetical protein [Corynebacterium freiburgense]|uniref:hypothetical protein n=1 Tax=Corynebacterium freiburgense TaxID=556548 RepID=UPI0004090534|nr:hypothetical protein [Corynebacterium freiburgense]WJZ02568.1 hypothetical protein CFREI_06405 [Corynebacterium freiburgense]